MRSWPSPHVPEFPTDVDGTSVSPLPALELYDTADDKTKKVLIPAGDAPVGMYICGITPYDSTHLGHAATYVTFDLVNRFLRAAGHQVTYVQNVTDVDDPLFERAERDGVDWQELGTEQTNLFRSDMTDLKVIPPQHYIGAIESIGEVVDLVETLLEKGAAYQLESEYADVYADHAYTPQFGYESRYSEQTMLDLFAERGGDPEREGKKHPLDALLWRAHRPGEPEWDAPFGSGRPGWHVECAAIATNRLGDYFAIQGGGVDLRYPHHEYSAAHVEASSGSKRMAEHYVHTGMIGLEGTKMSKSLGNLEFVSSLTADGVEPSAIRIGLYADHYRADRDWSAAVLERAEDRLAQWRTAIRLENDAQRATTLISQVAERISDDLDTQAALTAIDRWAQEVISDTNTSENKIADKPANYTTAGQTIHRAIDALLGVQI